MGRKTLTENGDSGVTQYDGCAIQHLAGGPAYVKALTRDGPSTYIDNARVEMNVLAIDDVVLPIVISEPKSGNADVCSPYTHYVRYTREELIKRNKRVPQWIFKAAIGSFGTALKICRLDRVVYINNWLFATNPHQHLSARQMQKITAYLQERYPRHAIVHRTINPYLHKSYYDALRENGYVMSKSRKVYLLDPSSENFLDRTNVKLDLQLLKRSPYDIVTEEDISDSEIPRLAELYRLLYLDKHCSLNPQLNTNFFSLTMRENILAYRVLKKNGQIDAFINFYSGNGVLTGAFVGYDSALPQKLGLYRQAIAILISEGQKRGLLVNLSAGVGTFKLLRGAFPVVEYDAVYDHHLSPRRRLAWRLVRLEGKAWSLGI